MKNEVIQFTTSQEELMVKMKAFLEGPDKYFLLTGKPGVGKSTMTEYMLKSLIEEDIQHSHSKNSMNVLGVTLAHQARKVLGGSIPNTATFAKAYGLKESFDKYSGARTFKYIEKNHEPILGRQPIRVFVHDECSQYNTRMLEIVEECTTPFSKVIFVGDRAQLPPIEEPNSRRGKDMDSPVFDMDIPEHCRHELTERVRQAEGNPILELSDLIREQIFGFQNINVILEAISKPNMKDGIGYNYVRYFDLLDHYDESKIQDTRIIAYRNNAVQKYNMDIRDKVMGNPQSSLVPGDFLVMNDTFRPDDGFGGSKYVLYNSDTYNVADVRTSRERVIADNKRYYIDSYVASTKEAPNKYIIIPSESGMPNYQKAADELRNKCLDWKCSWKEYYRLVDSFCNVDYSYAVTAYKSQGSTYDRVYVDINDILTTGPLTTKRKLQTIYTAITRAKYDCWFLKS